jgi:uncharacterized protein
MRNLNVVAFFGTIFLLYGLANYYVFRRCRRLFPTGSRLRLIFGALLVFLAVSYLLGRMLQRVSFSEVNDILVWIGSLWIAACFYLVMAIFLVDIVGAAGRFIPGFSERVTGWGPRWPRITGAAVVGTVALAMVAGHINALHPRHQVIDLTVPKKASGLSSVRIVMASDIHLGTIIGRERLEGIVARINRLAPDLVLLPGDIVDEDLAPVIHDNVGDLLRSIRAPYGVIAITGNHEYIGGVEEACRYLTEHGIVVLRDQVLKVAESLYVVGREDRSIHRFTGASRKPLPEIMAQVDRSLPVILMDHQPFDLEDAARNGVDIQLSGHTHHGQLWPINWITKRVYEVSWGYLRKGNTHVYVSSGVGTWGPPVRIGNRPEIVEINVRFE